MDWSTFYELYWFVIVRRDAEQKEAQNILQNCAFVSTSFFNYQKLKKKELDRIHEILKWDGEYKTTTIVEEPRRPG